MAVDSCQPLIMHALMLARATLLHISNFPSVARFCSRSVQFDGLTSHGMTQWFWDLEKLIKVTGSFWFLCSHVTLALLQVDTALKALSEEDDEVLREELLLKKALAASAKALQTRKLEYASVGEVIKNVTLLLTQGVQIPLENMLAMTRRRGTVGLADGELNVWLSALSLVGTPKDMSYGPCVVQLRDVDEQSVQHRLFQEAFVDTVFANDFMKQVNKLNDRDGDAGPLVNMCSRFLQQAHREKDLLQIGSQELAVLQNVQHALRGILFLASSSPVLAGDAVNDVSYIIPKNATTAPIISDLPKIGRLFVSKFRSEVPTCPLLQ